MSIQIVTSLLLASADLKARLPSSSVYPVAAPQNAVPPCIILNTVGAMDGLNLQGANGYFLHRVLVDVITLDATSAAEIGDIVMGILHTRVKLNLGAFRDVDTYFANVDLTQAADLRDSFKRSLHFFVRWRSA